MRPREPYEELLVTNPALRLVLPLMVGIMAGEWGYRAVSGCGGWLLLAASACMVLMLVFRRNGAAVSVALTLGMVLIGCGLTVSARDSLTTHWPSSQQTLRIVVLSSPKSSAKAISLTGSIDGGRFSGKKVAVTLMKKEGEVRLLPGDAVLVHTRVETPRASGNPCDFDRAAWLRRQDISGQTFCFAGNWEKAASPPSRTPLTARALRFRDDLITRYAENFGGRDLGILSAMTLGDRSGIDRETRQLFSETGVSHVLALSGLHLGILFSIYSLFVLKPLRSRRAKTLMSIVGIVGLWAFAFMAGLPLSLVRAASMFSCMQLLMCLRRRTFSVSNLTLSALLILLVSPMSLFDVGFQLSCLSVLAILLFVGKVPMPGPIARRAPMRWCWSLLSVSVVAQIATAPLVAFYFNQLPTYGLVANLLAVPLAYGILFLAFFFLALPFLQSVIAVPLGWLLSLMDGSLSWVASLPFSSFRLYPSAFAVVASYLLIVLLTAYALSRRPLPIYLSALTLAIGAGTEFYLDRRNEARNMIVFYDLRSATAIHFISSPAKSYLWLPDTARAHSSLAYVGRTFWQKRDISSPVTLSADRQQTDKQTDILCTGRTTLFHGVKVVLLTANLPYKAASSLPASQPLAVDYLVIARGYKQPLARALLTYRPRLLVLDSSLTDYYRTKFRQEASASRLPFHDIAESGALVVHTRE